MHTILTRVHNTTTILWSLDISVPCQALHGHWHAWRVMINSLSYVIQKYTASTHNYCTYCTVAIILLVDWHVVQCISYAIIQHDPYYYWSIITSHIDEVLASCGEQRFNLHENTYMMKTVSVTAVLGLNRQLSWPLNSFLPHCHNIYN